MEKIIFCFSALFFVLISSSMSFASIIPPEYSIDWSNCGIPAGAAATPVKRVDIKTDFQAVGNGKTDDSSAFNKAVAGASGPLEIYIPEGVYLLKSPVVINRDNIYITGAGADKTTLVFDLNGTTSNCITIAGTVSNDYSKAVDGFSKGSARIKIDNSGATTGGRFLAIFQDNDPAVMYTKPEWNQPWAKESVGQVFGAVSVKDGFAEIDEPLHLDFKKDMSPRLVKINAVVNCCISSLHLKRLDKGDADMIHIADAAFCSVRDIESEMIMRSHVSISESYKCEVENSYFHHAFDYGGGGHGYGVELKRWASNCLVQNNSFFHLRHSMMVHQGANGNVFGYNCSTGPIATGDHDPNSAVCDISIHGHYPFMNLFESNSVQKIELSDYWGPSGPGNTFLRNKIGAEGVRINDKTDGENFIGNVIVNADYGIEPAPGAAVTNILTQANVDYGEISYETTIKERDIPDSLYLKDKPDFIKVDNWPVFGPDAKGAAGLPACGKAAAE
jgi:hypothetical protein